MSHVVYHTWIRHMSSVCHTNVKCMSYKCHISMYVINESCRISHMDESRHISIRHIVYKCAISNVCHVSRFKKKCHIPRSQISSMSRCNVCHQWVMWYITHGRVTSHMNESRHIWMGHVTYEWVTSYMNGSRHIWMSHTKCMSSVTFQMYALCHLSSVCHTNVTYGCLIPSVCHVSRFFFVRQKKSCPKVTNIKYTPLFWLISPIELVNYFLPFECVLDLPSWMSHFNTYEYSKFTNIKYTPLFCLISPIELVNFFYICVCVYICMYMYIYIYTCKLLPFECFQGLPICVKVWVRVNIRSFTWMYMKIHIYMYTYTYIYIYIYTFINYLLPFECFQGLPLCVKMKVYVHIRSYTWMYMKIHI